MQSMWQGDILASLPRVPRQTVLSMLIHGMIFSLRSMCFVFLYWSNPAARLEELHPHLQDEVLPLHQSMIVEPNLKVKSVTAMSHATFSHFLNGTVILNDDAEPVFA